MRVLFFILISIGFCSNAFAQWAVQTTGIFPALNGVSFLNNDTGIAVGYEGTAVVTKNGGVTWTPLTTAFPSSVHNYAAQYVSKDTIFVAGGQSGASGYCCGHISRTVDGGITWATVYSGESNINKIYFISSTHGFAVEGLAGTGKILRTSNGGESWDEVYASSTADYSIKSITATDSIHFVAVGYIHDPNNPLLWANTESTLISYDTVAEKYIHNDVYMKSPENYFVVGDTYDSGAISYTNDGGLSWNQITVPFCRRINALQFSATNIAYAVCDSGKVLKSIDGGMSWIVQKTPIAGLLRALSFPSKNVGYVVGDFGTIMKLRSGTSPSDTSTDVLASQILSNIVFYPQPANNSLVISTSSSYSYAVDIYNLVGQLVYSSNENAQVHNINTANMVTGMYLVVIKRNDSKRYIKLEIVH